MGIFRSTSQALSGCKRHRAEKYLQQNLRALVNDLNHRQLNYANRAEDFYECLN
jgi:predicted protein tyrosine phosphatase